MERLLTVEFGPSCSKRFGRALAEARKGAGECSELEPGRYRATFLLGEDAAVYSGLGRLLERVRHWRATEVSEDDEPVSAFHAKDIKIVDCPFWVRLPLGRATGDGTPAQHVAHVVFLVDALASLSPQPPSAPYPANRCVIRNPLATINPRCSA